MYRRIKELVDNGILSVERSILSPDGTKYDLLKSKFKAIDISYKAGELEVRAYLNRSPEDKVRQYFSLEK